MHNLYAQFRGLIPEPALQVGTVVGAVVGGGSGVVSVELPGGGLLHARGSAALGQRVFVRNDVIESIAGSIRIFVFEALSSYPRSCSLVGNARPSRPWARYPQ